VWDSDKGEAVCAGIAIAENSKEIVGKHHGEGSLYTDLRLQFENELASTMRAVVGARSE
jgi:hypothetical protein